MLGHLTCAPLGEKGTPNQAGACRKSRGSGGCASQVQTEAMSMMSTAPDTHNQEVACLSLLNLSERNFSRDVAASHSHSMKFTLPVLRTVQS